MITSLIGDPHGIIKIIPYIVDLTHMVESSYVRLNLLAWACELWVELSDPTYGPISSDMLED